MKSIRARLLLGVLLATTLCLAASGAAIYFGVRSRMFDEQDRALFTIVQSNAPTMVRELERGAGPGLPRPEDRPREGQPPPPLGPFQRMAVLFQCWADNGSTIERSEALGDTSLPRLARDRTPIALDGLDRTDLIFASIALPDGSVARAVGLRGFPPPRPGDWRNAGRPGNRAEDPPPPVEFVFAQDITELLSALRDLRWLLVLTWFVTSLGCAAILLLVVQGSLRPLARLRRQIEDLDEASLDRRFATSGAPPELLPVVHQLNDLLARIEQAFEREQSFSAHAAHELRTPISGLRSTLEVAVARRRDPEEYREALGQSLEITTRMQSLVEDLLEMARGSEGSSAAACEEVPLSELVDESWRPYAEEASRRRLQLVREIDPALRLNTDARLLGRVLENLLENATGYADEGGRIDVAATEEGDFTTIRVSSPAADAPADVAERALDAFWRADSSRTDTGRHVGLGLALSQRIMRWLGGTIATELRDDRFIVILRLNAERTRSHPTDG